MINLFPASDFSRFKIDDSALEAITIRGGSVAFVAPTFVTVEWIACDFNTVGITPTPLYKFSGHAQSNIFASDKVFCWFINFYTYIITRY